MLQIKKRVDTKRGYRFMATICFYQDTRHEQPLYWIRDTLNIGYVSRRKDGMSELRINGFATINSLLNELKPYVRFKSLQVDAMVNATKILQKDINMLEENDLKDIVAHILVIQNENYKAHHKRCESDFYNMLGLTP